MTKTDYIIFRTTANRIEYYQNNNLNKHLILGYVDGIINAVRKSDLCSDELLRCLFDVRQQVVLGKEVQEEMEK